VRVWTLGPPTDRPFDGDSSLEKPGRWHRAGMRVAYTSESLPLALLELLVHLDGVQAPDLRAYAIDVPDRALAKVDLAALPPGWDEDPPPDVLCDVTGRWLAEGSAPALGVPSAIVDEGWNVLLNPGHSHWRGSLRPVESRPFEIDGRLL
jgi:RES domain-containing protein